MTKSINTLVSDIYSLVKTKGWFHDELSESLARSVSARLAEQFRERHTGKPTLRLSQMGPRCPRALWFSIHHPEMGEALPPWAEIKFSYGHILEAYIIALAKASGHDVQREQGHVELDGIVGHCDCVVDGNIIDVKSCSSRSFIKFKDGSIAEDDPFGYLDQLDGYVVGSRMEEVVTNKQSGYILAVDKTLGHLYLYEHTVRPTQIMDRIRTFKDIVGRTSAPPCTCKSIPAGKSGNLRLDVKASYNPYKYCCNPHLRCFLYADGPVFLTHVARVPDVPEIDRYGNVIYNPKTYHMGSNTLQ